jgi:hypothetical protein
LLVVVGAMQWDFDASHNSILHGDCHYLHRPILSPPQMITKQKSIPFENLKEFASIPTILITVDVL